MLNLIYNCYIFLFLGGNRSCELISVPLSPNDTLNGFHDCIKTSLYSSRALFNARRLLSLYLLSQNCQNNFEVSNKTIPIESSVYYSAEPINYTKISFESENEVFIDSNSKINPEIIIESYTKAIGKPKIKNRYLEIFR